MRVHYLIKEGLINEMFIEPGYDYMYNVYPTENGFYANRINTKLSIIGVLSDLRIILCRKNEGLEAYQVKGLSKEFIRYLNNCYKITLDMLVQIIKYPSKNNIIYEVLKLDKEKSNE